MFRIVRCYILSESQYFFGPTLERYPLQVEQQGKFSDKRARTQEHIGQQTHRAACWTGQLAQGSTMITAEVGLT
jgi:hypothetical protein